MEPIDDVAGNSVPQTNQPDIVVGGPWGLYVDDESKNKRGVFTVTYPVEHNTATDWDDATKESIAWLFGLDSRTTATVNRDELRLTSSSHEVLSRQQFHVRRSSKHRVPASSAGAH